MRVRKSNRRKAVIYLILGVIFALFSLDLSGALSQGHVARGIAAKLASDVSGILKLDGFDNTILTISNVNKRYFSVGSIANNFSQPINLNIIMTPDFSLQNNKSYWMGIKVGTLTQEFTFNDTAPKQISVTLLSGEVLGVQAALTGNQGREVKVSYNFSFSNLDNNFTMQAIDSVRTPRRMTLK